MAAGKYFLKKGAYDRRLYDDHVEACWLDERITQEAEEPTIKERVTKLEELVESLMELNNG